MKAADGFKWVRCLSCGEQYEIAHNPFNPAPPPCVVRTLAGKRCGGKMELVKNTGLQKPSSKATMVTHNELDDLLAPKGGLDRFLV